MHKKLTQFLYKHPFLKGVVLFLFGKSFPIFLDYPLKPVPRYGYGKPPHEKLSEILNKNYNIYNDFLLNTLKYKEQFLKISKDPPADIKKPYWVNRWISGLDGVSIYSFIASYKPKKYMEIGSGISTKFARHAMNEEQLTTKIISIDPYPRAEIDQLCDSVIRKKLEDCPLDIFDQLEENDILFVDNSHRVFMNSDVTVFFLDILPRLKKGVIVQIHDILLPFDYLPEWKWRHYSEQYLLAAYLLAEGTKINVLFPGNFISTNKELSQILNPLWSSPHMQGVESRGGCFWFRVA